MGYSSKQVAEKMAAGRATAAGHFKAGKLFMPVKGDCKPWADGYRAEVEELAKTHGRDRVRAMVVGKWEQ